MGNTTSGFGFGGASVSQNHKEQINKTYQELRNLIREAYEEGVADGRSDNFNDSDEQRFEKTFTFEKLDKIQYPVLP
jgi:hypothetical protein|tara:strand:+ start:69 stop:299 length:231 start_codon:yes stop_codon:yes gene_type:complete